MMLPSSAPGSLSLEHSSQSLWQEVPTQGKALGMTNVTPGASAARGGLPDPCHWPPSISPCQEAFGKSENKEEGKSYHPALYFLQ